MAPIKHRDLIFINMPKRIKFPKGLRKYIRKEKARIRREVLDIEEQKIKIEELYKNLFKPTDLKKQPEKPLKKKTITKKKDEKNKNIGVEEKEKNKSEQNKRVKLKKVIKNKKLKTIPNS